MVTSLWTLAYKRSVDKEQVSFHTHIIVCYHRSLA